MNVKKGDLGAYLCRGESRWPRAVFCRRKRQWVMTQVVEGSEQECKDTRKHQTGCYEVSSVSGAGEFMGLQDAAELDTVATEIEIKS